jgi:hypothetical protein
MKSVNAPSPFGLLGHQLCFFEKPEVARDRRSTDGHVSCELGHGLSPVAEKPQNLTTMRITERVKGVSSWIRNYCRHLGILL